MRIEGLLAAFPKLIAAPASATQGGRQHTFVETDSVRYVYQPVEALYLVLITTRGSNIVQDLETLRLLSKVVPDVAVPNMVGGGLQEQHVNDAAFELLFALDEVLCAGGHKEEATLSTIRTSLAMESHEEKMYLMMKESKEKSAKEEMQKQAKAIQDRQMQQMKNNFMNNGFNGFSQDGSQGGPDSMMGFGSAPGGGMGMGQNFNPSGSDYGQIQMNNPYMTQPEPELEPAPSIKKKGMTLGNSGAKNKNSFLNAMVKEDNLAPLSNARKAPAAAAVAAASSSSPATPVSILIEEKISVALNREGAVESSEIKGTLSLVANDASGADVHVAVNRDALLGMGAGWTFSTHPKVNKPSYEKSGVLRLKASGPGKGFPVGRPVGILRWGYNGVNGAPLTINCWPEEEGDGNINVNIEYELTRDMTLTDVDIMIPLGTADPPSIISIDGNYKHDARGGALLWHFDTIGASNASGSLEFSIPGNNTEAFFPFAVSFGCRDVLCPVDISAVTSGASGVSVGYAVNRVCIPESYQCA